MQETSFQVTESYTMPDPVTRCAHWQAALDAYLAHALNSGETPTGNTEKELP